MPLADRLYITFVHSKVRLMCFPEIDSAIWKVIYQEAYNPGSLQVFLIHMLFTTGRIAEN